STDRFAGIRDLARRRAPALVGRLRLRHVPVAGPDSRSGAHSAAEHVTLSASGDVLTIEATSASAACVGLARALETFFDADLSWDGPPQIDASAALPASAPQRVET